MSMFTITARVTAWLAVVGGLSTASVSLISQRTDRPGEAHHLIYDAGQRQILLLASSRESIQEEIWRWDGSAWRRLPGDGPPARHLGGATYDTRRKQLIIQGGIGPPPRNDRKGEQHRAHSLADTWTWDGRRWTEIKATGPSARSWHVMAFDSSRGRTLLYGGSTFDGKVSTQFHDTWEWDGRSWTRLDRD